RKVKDENADTCTRVYPCLFERVGSPVDDKPARWVITRRRHKHRSTQFTLESYCRYSELRAPIVNNQTPSGLRVLSGSHGCVGSRPSIGTRLRWEILHSENSHEHATGRIKRTHFDSILWSFSVTTRCLGFRSSQFGNRQELLQKRC